MLQRYRFEMGRDWDDGLPFMLFVIRESLGFSPSELVFGHSVRGALKLLQERFIGTTSPKTDILSFVSKCRTRLHTATYELPRAA